LFEYPIELRSAAAAADDDENNAELSDELTGLQDLTRPLISMQTTTKIHPSNNNRREREKEK
jgi:hypothetical protein